MGWNETTQSGGGDIITIVGGKWTKRVAEGTPGAQPRILSKGNHAGETVYECSCPAISGYVVGGKLVEAPYGMQCEVDLSDPKTGEEMKVQIGVDSFMLYDLINVIPNIDTTKEVSLVLYQKKKPSSSGKPRYGLGVNQNGHNLDGHFYVFRKDEAGNNKLVFQNGCPPSKKMTAGGWNTADRDDFLLQYFNQFFDGYQSNIPTHIETGSALDGSEGGYERKAEQVLADNGFVPADDERPPVYDEDAPEDDGDLPF